MKLYIISNDDQKIIAELLSEACEKRNIPYEILDPAEVSPFDVKIEPGDAVYRAATSANYGASDLEWDLIMKGAKSFFSDKRALLMNKVQTTTFEYLGVPVPKTAPYLPKDRDALARCVDELGGFPICIKALGGSHGVGVMRVDSMQSLFSVSDYVRQQGGTVVLKEYCNVTSSARLIVLGDEVIDSIEYSANKGDFRSNEGDSPNVAQRQFGGEVDEIAIRAVKSLGLEFGGVDIMLTEKGPKVAEVNYPCYFPRCQLLTGVDIAGKMVEYLEKK